MRRIQKDVGSMRQFISRCYHGLKRRYRTLTAPRIDIYKENEGRPVKKIENVKKVSAVIPNYNYEGFLNERIDSILFQTYPVSELIILDDCSTDQSVKLIEERIKNNQTGIPMKLIKNESNSGNVFAQWQKAFASASGDYVWIAEADDSCNIHFLETIMKAFDDPEVVISYSESLTMNEHNQLLMKDLREWIDIYQIGKWNQNYVNDGKEEVAETMCINNTLANASSAVFRKGDYFDILERAKSYRLAGDWYTYMCILRLGKIAYCRDSLNYHRMQSKSVTLTTHPEREFDEIVSLQNFAMKYFDITEETKEKIYERRARKRRQLGLQGYHAVDYHSSI